MKRIAHTSPCARWGMIVLAGCLGCGAPPAPPPVKTVHEEAPPEAPMPFTASTNKLPEKKRTSGEKTDKADKSEKSLTVENVEVRSNAKLEDFVGVWEGKWANRFRVRYEFVLSPDKKQILGSYSYEEQPNTPLIPTRATGVLTAGFLRVNRGMDIKLSMDDSNAALAIGRFPKVKGGEHRAIVRKIAAMRGGVGDVPEERLPPNVMRD